MSRAKATRTAAQDDLAINPDDWGTGLRFALKTLNVKTVKRATTAAEVLPICLRHNLRKNNKAHRHRRPIDPARAALNRVWLGSDDPEVCARAAMDVMQSLGIEADRADQVMGIELVFQPPDGWDADEFYAECIAWVRNRFQHPLSAVAHRDQKRPHMHVLVLAVQDGKLDGSAMTNEGNRWAARRADFMATMRSSLGIRPDRQSKPKTMAGIFTGQGKGAKTHAAAAKADAALMARASELPPNLIARQPHSPGNLIAPTSYCARLQGLKRLFAEGVAAGAFAPVPRRQIQPAPPPCTGPARGTAKAAWRPHA